MSKADYLKNKEATRLFEFGRTRIIAATNSLKIQRASLRGRGKPYIWIDPNWSLYRNGECICGAWSYPRHTDPAYLNKHRKWGTKFHAIDGARLLKVALQSNGVTVFKFSDGFAIHSFPSQSAVEGEQDYDDWYANITQKRDKGGQPRMPHLRRTR